MHLAGGSLAVFNAKRRTSFADSALVARVLTAVVGIPLVLLVIFMGGVVFKVAVVVVAVVAAWEGYLMLRGRGHRPALIFVLAMSALLAAAPASSTPLLWWQATVVVGAIASALWVFLSGAGPEAYMDWTFTIVIAVYTGGLLGFLTATRLLGHGLQLILLVLLLNWAYDTGAFFSGRSLGRTPFMNHISQKKTWEGVAGGVGLSVVAALILAWPLGVNVLVALVVGVVVATAAQLGDLLESLMKRYSDVKDSGSIIPGHGGLLDRVDSLLFSGAAAYYVFLLAGYH